MVIFEQAMKENLQIKQTSFNFIKELTIIIIVIFIVVTIMIIIIILIIPMQARKIRIQF